MMMRYYEFWESNFIWQWLECIEYFEESIQVADTKFDKCTPVTGVLPLKYLYLIVPQRYFQVSTKYTAVDPIVIKVARLILVINLVLNICTLNSAI